MDYEDHRQLFEKLPTKSREKIRLLFDASERAREAMVAAVQRALDERQELARAKVIAHNQENASIGRPAGFSVTASEIALRVPVQIDEAPARQALTEEAHDRLNDQIRAAQERLDRAQAAQEAATAEWEKFAYLEHVVGWLRTFMGHGGQLGYQKLPEVKLQRGETHRQAVERVRAQLSAVDAEWRRLEDAALPAEELKARIVAEVDALAAIGQPKIRVRDRFGNGISGVVEAMRLRRAGDMIAGDAPSAFIVWLNRNQIIDRLHAEVDAMDLGDAMTEDALDMAFSRLLNQKLDLAFQEEAFIVAAAAEGTQIDRRQDADPRAILQIREVFSEGEVEESDRPARGSAPAQPETAE